MGTFSEKILGSDNAIDVYEDFFMQYNREEEISNITKFIEKKYFKPNIDIVEKSEYLSALCKAKWETKSLDIGSLNELKKTVNDTSLYKLLRDFGATEKFIKARKKELEKFIVQISTERNKAKKRKKPPKKFVSEFENGTCFSFKFKNGDYGGMVVIKSELFTTSGTLLFAVTTIRQKKPPTINDFLNNVFFKCSWYENEQTKIKTAGIDCYSVCYLTQKKRKYYYEGLEYFFSIVGKINPFEDGYHCSTSPNFDADKPYHIGLSNNIEFMFSDNYKEIHKEIHKEIYEEDFVPSDVKIGDFYELTRKNNDCQQR